VFPKAHGTARGSKAEVAERKLRNERAHPRTRQIECRSPFFEIDPENTTQGGNSGKRETLRLSTSLLVVAASRARARAL